MTAPLSPEAVAQMVARLHGVSLDIGPIKSTTTLGSNEVRKAADMLTTLAAENTTLRTYNTELCDNYNSQLVKLAHQDDELATLRDGNHVAIIQRAEVVERLMDDLAALRASESAALERAEKAEATMREMRENLFYPAPVRMTEIPPRKQTPTADKE